MFEMSDPLIATITQNGVFFLIASLYVAIGARRAAGTASFPGPRPPEAWFKAWVVGLLLPLAALLYDGVIRGVGAAAIGLGFYLVMVVAQIATEIFVWKRWKSPIWVIVPCLYLSWRMWQVVWGLHLVQGQDSPLTHITFYALFVLWVINIGVHFTNIPMTLRWDYHPKSATFPALHDPNAFAKGAHDARDPQAGAKVK
jgi:hypothetical protein